MFETAKEVKEALFPFLRHSLKEQTQIFAKIFLNIVYLEKLKRKPLLCLFSIFSGSALVVLSVSMFSFCCPKQKSPWFPCLESDQIELFTMI